MQFIHTANSIEGTKRLSSTIADMLECGHKTLWLIAGGSNIPIAKSVMDTVRGNVTAGNLKDLKNLTVTLTDERFGPVGHSDSNWKQLVRDGFNLDGITAFPILQNLSLEDTVSVYGRNLEAAFKSSDVVIAQFGIGADGHIAGILRHTPAGNDINSACRNL